MSQTVADALRDLRLYSDERIYRLLKLPPKAITLAADILAEVGEPFCAMIADKDEATLLIPDDARAAFEARLRLAEASALEYRLITFDVELAPQLTGFIARIAEALAAAGIPVLTYAAYSRDHVFVPRADFDKAMKALGALQEDGD